jgi:hypothetical protein
MGDVDFSEIADVSHSSPRCRSALPSPSAALCALRPVASLCWRVRAALAFVARHHYARARGGAATAVAFSSSLAPSLVTSTIASIILTTSRVTLTLFPRPAPRPPRRARPPSPRQTWKKVKDDADSKAWAVFGVDEENKNKLVVVASGRCGPERLFKFFTEDVMAFAVLRVYALEGGVKQAKFFFVSWTPQAAPLRRKVAFNAIKTAVLNYFVGVAGSLQIATHAELTEAEITKRLDASRGGGKPAAYEFGMGAVVVRQRAAPRHCAARAAYAARAPSSPPTPHPTPAPSLAPAGRGGLRGRRAAREGGGRGGGARAARRARTARGGARRGRGGGRGRGGAPRRGGGGARRGRGRRARGRAPAQDQLAADVRAREH